jgi:hypothetical protein
VNDTIQRKEDMHEATNAASEPGFIDGGGACIECLLEEECNKLFGAALRVIGMRCFSFDADIPLTLYSFCGMGG